MQNLPSALFQRIDTGFKFLKKCFMEISVQLSWYSHTWLAVPMLRAFLAAFLATLEELGFGKKCCPLCTPHPKKTNMARSLIKERVSIQTVV